MYKHSMCFHQAQNTKGNKSLGAKKPVTIGHAKEAGLGKPSCEPNGVCSPGPLGKA